MFGTLMLTSVLAGLVATAVMVVFLYLPLLWRGMHYDALGAIGSLFTGSVEGRTYLIGGIVLAVGGIAFAVPYGAAALMFLQGAGAFQAPAYEILPNLPATIDLFYPLIGLVGGFGHGIFLSLIATFVITDLHPLPAYREPFPLIASWIIGHTVYGVVVTFFQHQLLQGLV